MRNHRLATLAGLGLLVVGLGVVLSAQTPPQRPIFRSGVDLIEVDVSVVDGDSRPITDLQASDFSVSVDGEPRQVVQAQFVLLRPENHVAPSPAEVEDVFYTSNADAARGRLIVIAVDEESILFGEGRHVMHAAASFVDSLSPADRVALVAVPQPGAYIDFTSDHGYVSRTIDGLSGLGRRATGDLNMNIGLFEAYQIVEHNDFRTQQSVNDRVCPGSAGPLDQAFNPGADVFVAFERIGCEQRVLTESRQIVRESRRQADNMRRGLEDILKALGDLEGPKAVLWISGGHVLDGAGLTLRTIENLAVESRTTLYVMMVDEPLGGDTTEASSSPTPSQDRRMKAEGLHLTAAMTRGTVFRAHFNPGPLFDRLESELSGYYLLGVESRPTDRDEARRSIQVSVQREGAQLRARREISFPAQETDQSADAMLARLLRSPVVANELPMRIATYAYQDDESSNVRVLVAADVGVRVGYFPPLTLGFILRDPEGTAVFSGTKQITPKLAETPNGQILQTSFPITVEPGTYSLRLAVVDDAGQSGSVEHLVRAWQQSDGSLAVGDLVVSDDAASPPGRTLPQVEARVSSGWLRVYTELYADSASVLDEAQVQVDVVAVDDDELGYTRTPGATELDGPNKATRKAVSTNMVVAHLPPGRYVARAFVTRDSEAVALLYRPFRIAEAPPPPEPQP